MKTQMTRKLQALGYCLVMNLFALFFTAGTLAQVPQMVRYESTLAIGGTNYHGLGQFKFALVNPGGTRTYWSNDGTSAAGEEPQRGTELEVNQGLYEVVLGDATLANMTAVPLTVFTNADVNVRVWFSPGNGVFQLVQPDQTLAAVGYAMMAAQVADGSITATQIAEGAVTAGKLAPQSVLQENLAFRAIGPDQLAPNAAAANLRSSGGLILSDQSSSSNLLSAGFKKIGSVNAEIEQWSTNREYCPSPRMNHVAAWTGTELFIWGGRATPVMSSLYTSLAAFYSPRSDAWREVKTTNAPLSLGVLGITPISLSVGNDVMVLDSSSPSGWLYNSAQNIWHALSTSNAPLFRNDASFVFTGSDVLVFGTTARHRYNLASDTWSQMSRSNAPTGRRYHSAVWTGTEMIIWGGDAGGKLRTGGRYDPVSDTWRPTSLAGAPMGRANHSAVWTGSKMIVWGGGNAETDTSVTATGGIYDPAIDSWQLTSTNGAPSAREKHFAVWASSQMLIWGGFALTNRNGSYIVLTDGARFNPVTQTWRSMAVPPTGPLLGESVTWTGTELIIWGGNSQDPVLRQLPPAIPAYGPNQNLGLRYNPVTDQWRYTGYAPAGRLGHSTVWTGKELIAWGGDLTSSSSLTGGTLLNSGGRFNPRTGKWQPLSTRNAPTARQGHQAVWTGKEMIVWGGLGSSNYSMQARTSLLNTGAKYNPATDTWTPIETNGAPSPRVGFSLVWTGSDAIVFGGQAWLIPSTSIYVTTNTGALYHLETDQWKSLSLVNAPSPRQSHVGLWTGEEMIIWGGTSSPQRPINPAIDNIQQGARYRPSENVWVPMSTNGTPLAHTNLAGVWTGEEMLIYTSMSSSHNASYSPWLDRWDPLPATTGFVPNSEVPIAVWTGSEMIVYGADAANAFKTKAARFNLRQNRWASVTSNGAPSRRYNSQGVWTGEELLSFGGISASVYELPNEVNRLDLNGQLYLYGRP
jgi:N-acetylneuraminic acid mutarotase